MNGYEANLISTIVYEQRSLLHVDTGYEANLISTIVDLMSVTNSVKRL